MSIKCSALIDTYLKTIRENFTALETEDGCHIVTPFTRPDGEAIEITVRKVPDGLSRISDEFATLDYLFLNGLNVESNRNMEDEALRLARLHGVEFYNSELFVETNNGDAAEALSKLLNAIEAITYLVYRRSHRSYRSFTNEVELFLLENEVKFNSEYTLPGKTITHVVPLYVNSNTNTVLWPLSATAVNSIRHRVKEVAFVARDIRDIDPTVKFDAILDDRKEINRKVWAKDVMAILEAHMDNTLHWEDRQHLLSTVSHTES